MESVEIGYTVVSVRFEFSHDQPRSEILDEARKVIMREIIRERKRESLG